MTNLWTLMFRKISLGKRVGTFLLLIVIGFSTPLSAEARDDQETSQQTQNAEADPPTGPTEIEPDLFQLIQELLEGLRISMERISDSLEL